MSPVARAARRRGLTAVSRAAGLVPVLLAAARAAALLPVLLAPERLAAREAGPPDLHLVLVNVAGVPPVALRALQDEAGALLTGGGAQVEWRRSTPNAATGPEELQVILVGGGHPAERGPSSILVATEPGAPRPAVWVYARAVARVLGLAWPPEAQSVAAQRLLGLATGRVVVHEIAHVLSPGTAHATEGLLASRVGRHVLIGPRPLLELPRLGGLPPLTVKGRDRDHSDLRGTCVSLPERGAEAPEAGL